MQPRPTEYPLDGWLQEQVTAGTPREEIQKQLEQVGHAKQYAWSYALRGWKLFGPKPHRLLRGTSWMLFLLGALLWILALFLPAFWAPGWNSDSNDHIFGFQALYVGLMVAWFPLWNVSWWCNVFLIFLLPIKIFTQVTKMKLLVVGVFISLLSLPCLLATEIPGDSDSLPCHATFGAYIWVLSVIIMCLGLATSRKNELTYFSVPE